MYSLLAIIAVSLLAILALLINSPHTHLSITLSSEAWASIIGAVLGTISAYSIGLIVERRTNKQHVEEAAERKIALHNSALLGIELHLQRALITLYKNRRLLAGISSTVKDGQYTATTPRAIDPRLAPSFADVKNKHLVSEWFTVELKLGLVNELIEDFNEDYKSTNMLIRSLLLQKQELNRRATRESQQHLFEMSNSTKEAVDDAIEGAKIALAITRCVSGFPKQATAKQTIPELFNYEVSQAEIEKALSPINEEFNDDMFRSL